MKHKFTLRLRQDEIDFLEAAAFNTGYSKSEIVRRIINGYKESEALDKLVSEKVQQEISKLKESNMIIEKPDVTKKQSMNDFVNIRAGARKMFFQLKTKKWRSGKIRRINQKAL